MSTFAPIRGEDFNIAPFEVNKEYYILTGSYSKQGYQVQQGLYYKGPIHISSSKDITYPKNADGSYKYIVYNSLNHLYYKRGFAWANSLEGWDRNRTTKNLFLTASLISIPSLNYGDKIKESTLYLKGLNNNVLLVDDGHNNLYDRNINTGSFLDSNNLCGYWGFQDAHKAYRYGRGGKKTLFIRYESEVIEPQEKSKSYQVAYSSGIPINGTRTGLAAEFYGDGYIHTKNFDTVSFESADNFTISFWLKAPVSQSVLTSNKNTILDKKSILYREEFGRLKRVNKGNLVVTDVFSSSSFKYYPVDYYPYEFSVHNHTHPQPGKLSFSRSDGFSTLQLTSSNSVLDNNFHHVCLVKTGSSIQLYVDGALNSSRADVKDETVNVSDIMIGASSFDGRNGYTGLIDELRFYNKAATSQNVTSLYNTSSISCYQTSRVGNVFYRTGNLVITSVDKKYHEILSNNWLLYYKNSLTLYEFEMLCRIKRGDFNLTLNPSSTKTVKSAEYLDDFTGSLSPYITTIGLYNKSNELIAVGKMGQAIKKRDDVDLNVIVKFDY